MKNNLKYIIPLLMIAGCTTTSCNNNSMRLSRETYDTVVPGISNLDSLLKGARTGQIDPNNHENWLIPEQGTHVANINIALTGSVQLYEYAGIDPFFIDLNDINVILTDKITTTWNLADNDYYHCINKNKRSYFIKRDKDKESKDRWIKYYNDAIDEKKYCENITANITPSGKGEERGFGNFKNYVMYQTSANAGFFFDDSYELLEGIGLDFSGFGGDSHHGGEITTRKKFNNYFFPGLINEIDIGAYPLGQVIDLIASYEGITDILPIKTKATKKKDNSAFSMSIDVNKFDFKKSTDLANKIKSLIDPGEEMDLIIDAKGSGTGAINYFASWKNNWINQCELALNFNKANLQLDFVTGIKNLEDLHLVHFNFKDLMATICINETFSPTCKSYKVPDTKDYILIN